MKKIILLLLSILILLLSVFVYKENKESKKEELSEFNIIINSSWYATEKDYYKQYYSEICRFNCSSEKCEVCTIFTSKNICNIMQLRDGRFCIVEKVDEEINLLRVNPNGKIEDKISLDWIPDQIIEYDNMVLLKQQNSLYSLDFINCKVVFWESVVNDDVVLYSNEATITYNDQENLYIYNQYGLKNIKTKSLCLGFIDKDTILLAKDFPAGFMLIYSYNIADDNKFGFKLVHIPGYINHAALSPDAQYLLYFTSNGEGLLEPYLLNMITFKKLKFNLQCDSVSSIQWIEGQVQSGDGSMIDKK